MSARALCGGEMDKLACTAKILGKNLFTVFCFSTSSKSFYVVVFRTFFWMIYVSYDICDSTSDV